VTKESAKAHFSDQVRKIPLLGNHHTIVKFPGSHDRLYKKVIAPIKALIHDALAENYRQAKLMQFEASVVGKETARTLRIPSHRQISPPADSRATAELYEDIDAELESVNNRGPKGPLSGVIVTTLEKVSGWTEALVNNLKYNFEESQLDRIDIATDGTCDWILSKYMYQNWISSDDAVLVLQGGPGVGKSVLVKSLIQKMTAENTDLNQNPFQRALLPMETCLVTHFFSKAITRDNSPISIMKHLLFQIWTSDSSCFEHSARSLYCRFTQTFDLDFYWSLFIRVRQRLRLNLIFFLDGFDECLRDTKVAGGTGVNERLMGFLRRLCDIETKKTGYFAGTTKVFITTRPVLEVAKVTEGRDISLIISKTDVAGDVMRVIEDGVSALVRDRDLPSPTRADLCTRVSTKSSGLFLVAVAALDKLRFGDVDLESSTAVQRALDHFSPEGLENAYTEVIENIETPDIAKASKIVRILYFAEWPLDITELSHALALDFERLPGGGLKGADSTSSLRTFIQSRLGSLVAIRGQKELVVLEHQTVRDFFRSLSSSRWQSFECGNDEEGHLHLALICIKYLIQWFNGGVAEDELKAQERDEIYTLFLKSHLLSYAVFFWDDHVREAKALIIPHMALVNRLMGLDGEDPTCYDLLLRLRSVLIYDQHDFGSWRSIPPANFLAVHNLVHVLRPRLQPRARPQHVLPRPFRSRKMPHPEYQAFDLDQQDWSGSTPLHSACSNGSVEAAKSLLEAGAAADILDSEGHTPFSIAVYEGHTDIAELLIQERKYFDGPRRINQVSVLHMASHKGMERVVEKLIADRYDPNARDVDGWTSVHLAAKQGLLGVLKILLAAGGIQEASTTNGVTPLYLAAQNGHTSVVKYLFKTKEDLTPAPVTAEGQTPLHVAARRGHADIFDILQRKIMTVSMDHYGCLPIHLAAVNGHVSIISRLGDYENLSARNGHGLLPIHLAAARGHADAVRSLIELGGLAGLEIDAKCKEFFDPDQPEEMLITPLYAAVSAGQLTVTEVLIEGGADIWVKDSRHWTLLHQASRIGAVEIFKLLRGRGLDPFAKADEGSTPLHVAAMFGAPEIVDIYTQLALTDGLGLDQPDDSDHSPLLWATSNGHMDVARKLINYGANMHLLNSDGRSIVMDAASLNDMEILKVSLTAGVDANSQDFQGWTALHFAANRGCSAACNMLIEHGASLNLQTKVSHTPLMLAAARCDLASFRELLRAGADPGPRDFSGLSVFEYAEPCQPLRTLLENRYPDQRPLSAEDRNNIIQGRVQKILRQLRPSRSMDQEEKDSLHDLLHDLGICFLRMRDYESTRICLEYLVRANETAEPVPDLQCDHCGMFEVLGVYRLCKSCFDCGLCNECYENRTKGEITPGCSVEHEFLELGGEVWRSLGPGRVNAEGQTLNEWIVALKQQLTVSYEPELVLGNGEQEERPVHSEANGERGKA
jgi:ankyrin repeat protein